MSCGQLPAACPALIWGEVMRIMSKVGRGRSGSCPTGPHCTMGHGTGRAQGALITRSVQPTGRERERAEGSDDDGWRSSRALTVDRSERQQHNLRLELFKDWTCWQRGKLCRGSLKISPTVPDKPTPSIFLFHFCTALQDFSRTSCWLMETSRKQEGGAGDLCRWTNRIQGKFAPETCDQHAARQRADVAYV